MASIRCSTGVQYAGYLIIKEGGISKKYWCVIRDGHFLVYPSHKSEPLESDEGSFGVEDRPVHKLSLSQLIVAGHGPQESKGYPNDCALELNCAASGEKITLHTSNKMSLQRWMDAVKRASYGDIDASFESPPGAPLPPALDFNSSYPGAVLRGSAQLRSFGGEVDAERRLSEINANYKLSKPLNTSLLFSKLSSKEASKYTNSNRWSHPRGGANTPQSSSEISSPSSTRSDRYKDSADESSVSSSLASSPVITPRSMLDSRNMQTAPANNKHEQLKSPLSLSAGKPRVHMFYTGEKNMDRMKSTPGMRHVKKRSLTAPKRHTISSMPNDADPASARNHGIKSQENSFSHNAINQSTGRYGPARLSIAPISQLDQQIRMRSSQPRSRGQSLMVQSSNEDQLDSDSSVETPLEEKSLDVGRLRDDVMTQTDRSRQDHSEPNEPSPSIQPTTIGLQPISVGANTQVDEVSSPVLKIKRRLLLNSRPISPHVHDSRNDNENAGMSRTRSGSFGSRILRRAKSVVGKRNKSLDVDDKISSQNLSSDSIEPKESGSFETAANLENNNSSENFPIINKQRVLMTGLLYLSKKMKWTKTWAVLDSTKTLSFYKSEQRPNSVDAAIMSIKLVGGCEVINISQAKHNNTFMLVSKTTIPDSSTTNLTTMNEKKTIKLMCKSNEEFVHWVKALVLVNTIPVHELSTPASNPLDRGTTAVCVTDAVSSVNTDDKLNSKTIEDKQVELAEHATESGGFEQNLKDIDFIDADDAAVGGLRKLKKPNIASRLDNGNSVESNLGKLSGAHLLHNASHFGTDIEKVTSVTFRKTGPNDRLLLNEATTFTSTCNDKCYELADASNPSVIEVNRQSSKRAQNNEEDGEQWDTDDIKPREVQSLEVATTTNKLHSEIGVCHAGADKTARAVSRGARVDSFELISRRVRESHAGSSAQTTLIRERASEDKRILSHRLPSSYASSVDIAGPEKPTTITAQPPIGSSSPLQQSSSTNGSSIRFSQRVKNFVNISVPADITNNDSYNNRTSITEATDSSSASYRFSNTRIKSTVTKCFDESHTHEPRQVSQNRRVSFPDLSLLNFEFTESRANLNILRRTKSEGNILELSEYYPRYKMRTIKTALPELTRIDFIEVYGISPSKGNRSSTSSEKVSQSFSDNESEYLAKSSNSAVSVNKDISDDGYRSSGNEKKSHSKNSKCSSASEESSKEEKRSTNWFSTFRRSIKSNDDDKTKSGKMSTVLKIPASQLSSASHRGYVDRRNKKKQWERFWCVLQDSCLYCYNSPHSDVTRDVVLLRGYDVTADVTNMNRSRFVFRLEQQGAQTLYFASENHEEFLLWVGTLEKDTRCVNTPNSLETEKRRISASPSHISSDADIPMETTNTSSSQNSFKRTISNEKLEEELVEMQKHKLLKEIATQQQKLIEEQRHLEAKFSDNSTVDGYSVSRRNSRRSNVIDKYERVRSEEEVKMTKFMTLLNRRRNSAQIKVDQLSREIGPKSGKKRRQNHQHFAAYEAKLNEMKEKLAEIDMEINEQQAQKQNVFEKLQERQDLELLVAEQQESLEIMRRHENDEFVFTVRRRRKGPREALTSIEELSSISDCCSSSSDSMNETPHHVMSTPRTKRNNPGSFEATSSESVPSEDFAYIRQCDYDVEPMSSSLDGVIATSSMSSSISSLTVSHDSLSSANEPKRTDQVDPSVMAGIEMFEAFSKITLEKLGKKRE